MRPLFALLLLLMAGCSDSPGSSGTDEADGTAGDGGAPPSDPSGDDGQASNQTAQTAPGEPEEVDWEGALATGACVPAGPNSCMGMSLGSDDYLVLERAELGNAAVELVLDWDATASPWARELEFSVWPFTSCGQGCYMGSGSGLSVTGTSPLALSGDVAAEADGLFLDVRIPRVTPDPVYGYATVEAPFHVTGTVTPA